MTQQHIDAQIRAELNQAFRFVLRHHEIKGSLAEFVADLEGVVEAVLLKRRLSTEDIAMQIDRDGGFMRVGDDGLVNGQLVSAGQLIDALLFLIRRDEPDTNEDEATK